jgi:hypothetical protein
LSVKRSHILVTMAIGAWLAALAFGLAWAARYSAVPCASADGPAEWPRASRISRAEGAQLVLFAHPECPCTRSTLRELERMVARVPGLSAAVVFSSALPEDPRGSSLWPLAQRIPGVAVVADAGGAEARLFGAATSGQAVLVDRHGRIVFRGGLTAARGHEGDAPAQDAIAQIVQGKPAPDRAPVFGCSLF